jgi:hypothetical protein
MLVRGAPTPNHDVACLQKNTRGGINSRPYGLCRGRIHATREGFDQLINQHIGQGSS